MLKNNATVRESYIGHDGRMRVIVRADDRVRLGDVIVTLEQDWSPYRDGQRVRLEDGKVVS